MQTITKSIDVEDDLLTSLAEIYEVDTVQEAVELALWRLADILEIEALNRENRDDVSMDAQAFVMIQVAVPHRPSELILFQDFFSELGQAVPN